MECVRRRGKVYCVVITVPADLSVLIGKKQIWRSLKTKDYMVARSQARKLLGLVDQLFSQVRDSMDSRQINAIAAEFGLDLLRLHDEIRRGTIKAPPHADVTQTSDLEFIKKVYAEASKTAAGRAMLEVNAMVMAQRIQERIFTNKPEELHFVAGSYESLLDKHGIDLPPAGSSDEKELMAALAQTAKLAYLIEQERVQGIRDESDLQDRLISKWTGALPPKQDAGLPITQLLDRYYVVWEKDYRKKSNVNEYRIKRKFREIEIIKASLIDYFGKDIGIRELDEEKAVEWRDFHQSDNQLSNSSINKYLDHVSAAFRWATDRQRKYVDYNPFEKTSLPEGVKRERTREFSQAELQSYLDMLSDSYLPKYPEHTWIPLMILYQGMRNNEIAQLFVDDIQEREGILYIRILGTAARNQRIKADASQRNIPIHSKLIELGFMQYVANMRAAGQDQLFPNCLYNQRTGRYYDDNLSARLNTVVDSISTDKKLRVYSLRANFKTAIENRFADAAIDAMEGKASSLDIAGLEKFVDRAFNDVMGHSIKGGTGDTTYRKVQLRLMKRIVEQAEYPVDISKLKKVLA